MKPSKFPVWGAGNLVSFPGRPWRRSSNPGSRRFSPWFITKWSERDLPICSPLELSLPAGAPSWKVFPSWPSRFLICPFGEGTPVGIGGLVDLVASPMYATGVGLVLYGSRNKAQSRFKVGEGNVFSKVTHRMREWIEEFF